MIKNRQQLDVRGSALSRVICAALGLLALGVWIFRPDAAAPRTNLLPKTTASARRIAAQAGTPGAPVPSGKPALTHMDHRWVPEATQAGLPVGDLSGARDASRRSDTAALAELVSYEAGMNLRLLTELYGLSPTQQQRMFPIVAMMSPDYAPTLPIEGVAANDPYLAALRAAARVSAPESESSFDALEDAITPLLTSEQVGLVAEEQLDRYYWWTEVLSGIAADADAELNAAVQAALALPEAGVDTSSNAGSPPDGASSTSPPPEDHQVDNLLDFLNGGG